MLFKKQAWILGAVCLLLSACELVEFEYSPNQVFDKNTPRNINIQNMARLSARQHDDTLRFVFTGDSQRYYDEAEALVKKVNSIPGVDFLVLAGDISDFGLRQEFEWIVEIFNGLQVPYLAAIGNHDLVAKGGEVYDHVFGPRNFSIVCDSVKLVFHDSNGREYGFNQTAPNMGWLQAQFKPEPGVKYYLPVSHVPPYDVDFDPALVKPYTKLLAETPGVIASLHGHLHQTSDWYPFDKSTRYINSNSVEKRSFILFDFVNGKLIKRMVSY